MTILDLITTIQHRPDCRVLPPQGLPPIQPHHRLPDDLRLFYAACGGMHLLRETDYPLHIRAPHDVVLTNTILLKGSSEADLVASHDDITWSWYTIADDGNGDYLSIDLSLPRLGRCYDSFWDRHGVVGSCPIIALSFTALLQQAIHHAAHAAAPYWLRDDFLSLGDAYDEHAI